MGDLVRAHLEVEGGEKIQCLYNPESISVSHSNSWTSGSMPGKGVPTLKFGGSSSGKMNIALVFDTTDTGKAVTQHTDKILKLMDIDPGLPGTDEDSFNGRPPTVVFHWGDVHSFPAVVVDASVTFDYFSANAVPLRANVSLSLLQYKDPASHPAQNPTSGTPKPGRVHRVQPGETLDRISARYYGDSTRWRLLASANGLEDPLALRPGALLDIPRLEN
ncbi:LysM peptidoglycan-binding domain-containing protein [soil metagenome]